MKISDAWQCWFRRTHQSLASVGVAASVRLINSAGDKMSPAVWSQSVQMLARAAKDTFPDVQHLATAGPQTNSDPGTPQPNTPQSGTPKRKQVQQSSWSKYSCTRSWRLDKHDIQDRSTVQNGIPWR